MPARPARRRRPGGERFYAITGIEGTTLETRDLTGRAVTTVALPESHVGWRLALSLDRSELAVLARSAPMERENWFFAEVDRLLVIDLETGAYTSYPLPAGGFARLLEVRGSGYVVAVSQWESSTIEISQLARGEIELIDRLPAEVGREALAVGPETIIFTPPSQDAYPAYRMRLDLAAAGAAVAGLVDSRLAITSAGTEITNLPPHPHARDHRLDGRTDHHHYGALAGDPRHSSAARLPGRPDR